MNSPQQLWREMLGRVADSESWVEAVLQSQRDVDFVLHGQPAMRVAEPLFVTRAEIAEDRESVAAVLACLQAAGEALIADPHLRADYAAEWWSSMPDPALFALPSGYQQQFVMGRLDGVRTRDGLRFLEFNGGLPGGILSADESPVFLAKTDVGQQFADRCPFALEPPGERAIDAVVSAWHEFGGSGLPFVVVALPDELRELAGKQVRHLRDLGAERGLEMEVADPGELTFAGTRLQLRGRDVDVAVRAFFTPMFGYLGPRLDPLLAALRAGAVCMVTSLQSGLYGLKSLFAMVTDPSVELDVATTVRERAMVNLPWTRMVRGGFTTDPEGGRVELPAYLLSHQNQLVVKPTAGYGGAGVELGWQHSEQTWREVVDRAMSGGHIAQLRVEIADQELPDLARGFPLRAFTADHNPLICDGELAGYFVRLAASGGGLTNLSTGEGTMAGVFVVD